jgi:hypothetical protein
MPCKHVSHTPTHANLLCKNCLLFIINAAYESISGKDVHILVYMNPEQLFEWDRLINKKVISSDLQEIGNIVAVDDNSMIILREAENQYRIPKSRARAFIDNDLLVDFRLNDLLLVELASLSYIV